MLLEVKKLVIFLYSILLTTKTAFNHISAAKAVTRPSSRLATARILLMSWAIGRVDIVEVLLVLLIVVWVVGLRGVNFHAGAGCRLIDWRCCTDLLGCRSLR